MSVSLDVALSAQMSLMKRMETIAHNVANALRDMRRAKRDVARERPLEPSLERSGLDVASWLAADQGAPAAERVRDDAHRR